MRGEGLEVGLNAGAAARVAAGNCQRSYHLFYNRRLCPPAPRSSPTTRRLLDHVSVGAATSAARTSVRVASVLFLTALTAAAAQISVHLPFTPVPLTLQPMIVLVGAAALGPRLGALEPDALPAARHRRHARVCRVAHSAARSRPAARADRRLPDGVSARRRSSPAGSPSAASIAGISRRSSPCSPACARCLPAACCGWPSSRAASAGPVGLERRSRPVSIRSSCRSRQGGVRERSCCRASGRSSRDS